MEIAWRIALFVLLSAAVPAGAGEVRLSVPRGFQERAFELRARAPAELIRFTTDGSEPTLQNGTDYAQALAISSNTILRIAGFQNGQRVTPIATHTYLFAGEVARQSFNPPGFPAGQSAWNGFPSAYGMDPRVVNDPLYKDKIRAALQSLPVLSIVCKREDLFSQNRGIYLNAEARGVAWERPCSAELILTNGECAFQIDCGVKIQGNSNRMPFKTPKHSFRLMFRQKYGTAKLHYQVFPDSPVKKFDTLVLRADFNNSWLHWDENHRDRAQRTRDAWMKDSHRAMGWVAGHNRFVHLYLNGLYWGVYDIAERLDGSFGAAYFGGQKEDYDVINEFEVKNGTMDAFAKLQSIGDFSVPANYRALQQQLDLTQFIDFLLLNYYAGNIDMGEHKNWYALRPRDPPGRFQFMVWDPEQILCDPRDDTVNDSYVQPFHLVQALQRNAEYRLAFADRAQKHLFNNGALTAQLAIARWMKRANELDLAIIAESARWGYYRRKTPFTRNKDWLAEQQRLLTSFFPDRTRVVLDQLRSAGLYPKIAAPLATKTGENITLKAPEGGEVYYTTDGFDPRVPGTGAVSPHAQLASAPIKPVANMPIKARILKRDTWSALLELPI